MVKDRQRFILREIILLYQIKNKKEKSFDTRSFNFMYQTNQDPNVDINTKYFTSQENEQSNMLHNKRNSGVISNLNENTQT